MKAIEIFEFLQCSQYNNEISIKSYLNLFEFEISIKAERWQNEFQKQKSNNGIRLTNILPLSTTFPQFSDWYWPSFGHNWFLFV